MDRDHIWAATRAGLVLGRAFTISFQRYLLAGRASVAAAPSSLGALAPGEDPGGAWLVPLHPGEAVWIGVTGSEECPAVRAVARRGTRSHDLADGRPAPLAEATPIPCRPVAVLAGLPRPDGGFLPFAARRGEAKAACSRLDFEPLAADGEPGAAAAHIELVTLQDFTSRTGRPPPPPADPGDGYRGWRLP